MDFVIYHGDKNFGKLEKKLAMISETEKNFKHILLITSKIIDLLSDFNVGKQQQLQYRLLLKGHLQLY